MNTRKNYPLLLASQFLSALADNAILQVILGPLMVQFKNGQITEQQQSIANIIYTSVLLVPYVLFATWTGYLNDRYPKTLGLLGGNVIKLIGTGVTMAGIWYGPVCQGFGYFIVGIGACLYSPAKYGILPEILPRERLVKANGTVELLTLVAILLGSISGAAIIDKLPVQTCYFIVAGIYGLSLVLNLLMSPTPAYPNVQLRDSTHEFKHNLLEIVKHARLLRILIGTSLFWICGALLKMNFQPWGQQVLHLGSMLQINLLGLWLSVGVMIGSVLAGQWYKVGDLTAARRHGFFLAGTITLLGLTQWFMKIGLTNPSYFVIPVLIIAGIAAGLFLIPLNAALQAESHQDKLGKTIATQNLLENLAMLGGSTFAFINVKIGFNPSQLLLALAVLVFLVVTWLRIPKNETAPATVAH